jgi:hypothetical protein
MAWAFPFSHSPLLELDPDALLEMLKAVNVITKHFPGSCIDFCMAPWQEIDEWLHESGDLYPKFHKLFMSSLLNVARWRPRLVTWTFGSFLYFADPHNCDAGIPGLEIMAILFRDDWDLDEEFRTLDVCEWLVSELDGSAYQRRIAIMRCLCAFLARVHPDVAGYDAFFVNLAPFLDDFMSSSEFGELLYLSLFILLWFVRHEWCNFEQLMSQPINTVRSVKGIIHHSKGSHCSRSLPSAKSARLVILSLKTPPPTSRNRQGSRASIRSDGTHSSPLVWGVAGLAQLGRVTVGLDTRVRGHPLRLLSLRDRRRAEIETDKRNGRTLCVESL